MKTAARTVSGPPFLAVTQNGAAIFYQPLEMFKEILMSK